jgi:predicted PurR-regulated permease PerM
LTIDAAIRRERLGTVTFYAIVLLLAYLSYRLFEPFLAPLAWAAILVVLTYPVYQRLAKRFHPGTAAMWATIGVTVLLIFPMTLVLSAFVKQAVSAVHSIQIGVEAGHYEWVNRLWEKVQERFPGLIPSNLGSIVQSYVDRAAGFAAAKAGAILRNTATFILDVTVTIFAMFYFYKDGTLITRRIRDGLPFETEQRDRLMEDTHSLVFATVLSTLAAAAMHGTIGMLTFALTGIHSPVFWGVLMGFFSFIPLIGTALIWVPLALSLLLGGHVVAGIVLAVMCGGVIGTLDSFLRPYIISGRAEMNMLLVFIGVLGGIEVFGMLGVVLGPIVIAIAGTLLQFYVPRARGETRRVEGAEKTKAAVLE